MTIDHLQQRLAAAQIRARSRNECERSIGQALAGYYRFAIAQYTAARPAEVADLIEPGDLMEGTREASV